MSNDHRDPNATPMLQTSVERSGDEWVVMANVDGESREMSRHPDQAAANDAQQSLHAASEGGAEASGDHAG